MPKPSFIHIKDDCTQCINVLKLYLLEITDNLLYYIKNIYVINSNVEMYVFSYNNLIVIVLLSNNIIIRIIYIVCINKNKIQFNVFFTIKINCNISLNITPHQTLNPPRNTKTSSTSKIQTPTLKRPLRTAFATLECKRRNECQCSQLFSA